MRTRGSLDSGTHVASVAPSGWQELAYIREHIGVHPACVRRVELRYCFVHPYGDMSSFGLRITNRQDSCQDEAPRAMG